MALLWVGTELGTSRPEPELPFLQKLKKLVQN